MSFPYGATHGLREIVGDAARPDGLTNRRPSRRSTPSAPSWRPNMRTPTSCRTRSISASAKSKPRSPAFDERPRPLRTRRHRDRRGLRQPGRRRHRCRSTAAMSDPRTRSPTRRAMARVKSRMAATMTLTIRRRLRSSVRSSPSAASLPSPEEDEDDTHQAAPRSTGSSELTADRTLGAPRASSPPIRSVAFDRRSCTSFCQDAFYGGSHVRASAMEVSVRGTIFHSPARRASRTASRAKRDRGAGTIAGARRLLPKSLMLWDGPGRGSMSQPNRPNSSPIALQLRRQCAC